MSLAGGVRLGVGTVSFERASGTGFWRTDGGGGGGFFFSPALALCLYNNKAFWHKRCVDPRRDLEMPVRRNARTLTLWGLENTRDCVGGGSRKTEMLGKGR